jgi:molecular chaperone DnaJ
LGLTGDPSEAELKAAYRNLARIHHPDRSRGEQAKRAAEQRLKRINEAYSWLVQHREAA